MNQVSDGSKIDFDSMNIEETLKAIDDHYTVCKGRYNRLSIEWGKWSVVMNVSLRKRLNTMKQEDPERDRWIYVHAYWIIRSRLLNLYLKNKMLVRGKIKRLLKELKDYRKFATKGGGELTEEQLVRMLIKKV